MSTQILPETTYQIPEGDLVRVRPVREEDLPGMEWDGEFAHFRRLYKQHFQNSRSGNTLIWVVENEDGEIVGQVFLSLLSSQSELADGIHRAYLFSFRLKPDYRNHGLGSHMLDFVESYLVRRGFDTLRINVARDNVQARRMYERHGYRVIGPEEGRWRYQDQFGQWQSVHEPAWRMLKKLK